MANLNDPEFNPLKEMMYMPTINYVKRFAIMLTLFGTIIVFIVWIPVKFIKMVSPDFLPYRVFAISDEPLNHVSLELVTLQVFLPTLLEQTHIKIFLKTVIRLWAESVGYILDLRGYLLGERIWRNFGEAIDEPDADRGAGFLRQPPDDEGLDRQDNPDNGEDDDVIILGEEIRTHHVYNKPANFKFRVFLLLLSVALSLTAFATCLFYFPVRVGREILGYLVGTDRKIHEMYTLFLGLFVCWLPLLAATVISRWAPMGRKILFKRLQKKLKIASKILFAFVAVAGGIALLFGLLFDLVFLTPLRVPLHQTPITYVLVDWAFGAVHVKIAVAFTLLGPNWWLRDALENIYNQGARNFRLRNFLWVVVWPVASTLIIMLSIPYIIAFGLVPLIPADQPLISRFQRRVYPAFFFGALGMFILHIQYLQFCRLIESIKNSKYLVGQRLVNYDPNRKSSSDNNTAQSGSIPITHPNPNREDDVI
jgi:E3 ubiquitin-protein ligase MARCH6